MEVLETGSSNVMGAVSPESLLHGSVGREKQQAAPRGSSYKTLILT